MEKLSLGVAYHGNRILRHVEEDMRDIVNHGMDTVVHMFSHNDWDRHLGVMREIVDISHYYGLDVWIDNWGLGGPPGDKSHFLSYHPEAHQVYADGTTDPVRVCFNNPDYRKFVRDWLDAVRGFGGDKIFWDEPHFVETSETAFTCCCPTCRKLFEERYNKPMPTTLTPEVREFHVATLSEFFREVTDHSHSLGMKNYAGVMVHTLHYAQEIISLPHLDNFGVDPYWHTSSNPAKVKDPYDFVYTQSRDAIEACRAAGKENHIWIQGYKFPAGTEDEIVTAADAAYDAGARTLLWWGFRGSESNTYKSEKCERTWYVIGEAVARLRARYFDEIRAEKRRALGITE